MPKRVHTVVVSLQHSDKVTLEELREQVMNQVVKEVIPTEYFDANTIVHINPCGLFIIGGPMVRKSSSLKKTVYLIQFVRRVMLV